MAHASVQTDVPSAAAGKAAEQTPAEDDSQEEGAPIRLMAQFLKAVSEQRMGEALELTHTILRYEPGNVMVIEYQAVLQAFIDCGMELDSAVSSYSDSDSSSDSDGDVQQQGRWSTLDSDADSDGGTGGSGSEEGTEVASEDLDADDEAALSPGGQHRRRRSRGSSSHRHQRHAGTDEAKHGPSASAAGVASNGGVAARRRSVSSSIVAAVIA
jgi:hypothetical protein